MELNKIVHIGKGPRGEVFCRININDGKLSITGVEGPMASGDCRGACGQIIMDKWNIEAYATGWNEQLEEQFRNIWDEWHLNDMTAGSPSQEHWLKKNPISKADYAYPKSHYDVASERLAAAGLNPDENGYRYGHAWLKRELPVEVVEFLVSLPESKLKPAWC